MFTLLTELQNTCWRRQLQSIAQRTRVVRRLASLAVTVLAAVAVSAMPASASASLMRQGVEINGVAEATEAFGNSIALSTDGSTAVIGSPEGNGFKGAAWVYVRSGSGWVEQAELEAGTEALSSGEFGYGVAISGDGNTVIASQNDERSFVFTRSGTTWAKQATLMKPSIFVALSSDGNTALLADPLVGEASPGAGNPVGQVTVFTRSGATWTEQQTLTPPVGKFERFGEHVSLSADGDTALIIGAAEGPGSFPGGAWVYSRSGSTWTQQQKLTAPSEIREGKISGDDGTIVAVDSGQWQTFSNTGSSWAASGEPQALPAGSVGLSLSANGATALANVAAGAQIYTRTGSTWTPEGAPLENVGDMGFASESSGSIVLSPDASTAMIGDGVNVWGFVSEGSPAGGSPGSGSTGSTSPTPTGSGSTGSSGSGTAKSPVVLPTVPAKPLTQAQKLAKALKACKKQKSKSKRKACEARAKKRFKPKQKKTTKPKQLAPSAGAAASKAFSGNVCGIPTPTELAAAGITMPCTKGKPKTEKGSGGMVEHTYTAQWGTVGAESDLPGERPNLTIKISKFTGSKTALAKIEHFELAAINLKVGATNINKPVKVGGAPGGLHIKRAGTGELLVVSGHLYTILIHFNEKEPFGTEANLGAEIDAIGSSSVAAL
jgi:hypothetical protein